MCSTLLVITLGNEIAENLDDFDVEKPIIVKKQVQVLAMRFSEFSVVSSRVNGRLVSW